MANELEFKTPDQIADEYLLHLRGLKPDVNDKQTDSDWYIKSKVYGGVVAGVYSDAKKVSNDAFPQDARRDALEKHVFVYFNDGFSQPTQSNGFAIFTGATGSIIGVGVEGVYGPNGNSYVTDEEKTITEASGVLVSMKSVASGQEQNLLEGAVLEISSPPPGTDPTATVASGPFSDGRDVESNDEAAERVLTRIREPIRGGTAGDYEQWAVEANDAVTRATAIRYFNGLGTMGVVITAGTTNIDEALDNGVPIVTTPSQDLINEVEDYLNTKRPHNDCVKVFPAVETVQDVTVKVRFSQGDLTTILAGQALTQEELVQREVQRALYKHDVGGQKFDGEGYVVASHIEEVIDQNLSNEPHTVGALAILEDRQVLDLSTSGVNRGVLVNETVIPGTITVQEF